jgi:hypothetical protein
MTIHPIHWLYQQHGNTVPSGDEQCYLCGSPCTKEHTVAKGIADTFNSHYLAKCPSSPVLCSACHWYFNDKEHPEFRKMSLVVQCDSWLNWQRDAMKADITRWLTTGLEADGYLVVSLSKKKHILLQAPMNAAGSRELAIQVEEQVAHVTLNAWQRIDNAFMSLLRLGHNKGEILSGDLYGNTLRKHGRIIEALQYSSELEPWRKSPQIELLSYVTIYERGETIDKPRGESSRGDNAAIREGTRDKKNSSSAPKSRMERHRQRVPEQIQNGNMEDVRGESSGISKDHEQLSLFSF